MPSTSSIYGNNNSFVKTFCLNPLGDYNMIQLLVSSSLDQVPDFKPLNSEGPNIQNEDLERGNKTIYPVFFQRKFTYKSFFDSDFQLPKLNDKVIEKWKLLLQHSKKDSQHAIAVVFMKDLEPAYFNVDKPIFRKRKTPGSNLPGYHEHTEQMLLKSLDTYLEENSQALINDAADILIYTKNSPCFKREPKNMAPCVFLIMEKVNQWQEKYGKTISVHVGFTKHWGPLTPHVFKNLKYSEISNTNSVFNPYAQKYEDVKFPLDLKNFRNKCNEIKQRQVSELKKTDGFDLTKLKDIGSIYKKCLDELQTCAKSKNTRNEYLKYGRKIFDDLQQNLEDKIGNNFKTLSDDLYKRWCEELEKTMLKLIKKEMTEHLNAIIVDSSLKHHQLIWGQSSLLYFCWIDEEQLLRNRSQCSK